MLLPLPLAQPPSLSLDPSLPLATAQASTLKTLSDAVQQSVGKRRRRKERKKYETTEKLSFLPSHVWITKERDPVCSLPLFLSPPLPSNLVSGRDTDFTLPRNALLARPPKLCFPLNVIDNFKDFQIFVGCFYLFIF